MQPLLKIDRKNSARIFSVITNSVKQTIGQLMGLLLSVYVIHYYSKGLWGSFVPCLLYVSVALLVLGWGNKDYLLREFSKTPSEIAYRFYVVFQYADRLAFACNCADIAVFSSYAEPVSRTLDFGRIHCTIA